MFHLPQPSMALNSHDVPPPDYHMFNTYKVSAETSPQHMLGWAARVATDVGGGLRCLVINSHGSPGKLHIGTGIRDAWPFGALSGKVTAIFIVACQIVDFGGGTFDDGNLFCGAVAKASGATVFCSTALQTTGAYWLIGLPFGAIDEYEGTVYRYKSDGSNEEVHNDDIREYVRKLTA